MIQLGEKEDYEAVLSVLEPVTSASPTASLRKQYLRLSALIHPDKLGRRFDGATKAFQARGRRPGGGGGGASGCYTTSSSQHR